MIKVHLYTTDISAFRLIKPIIGLYKITLVGVIVPKNRIKYKKVLDVISYCNKECINIITHGNDSDIIDFKGVDVAISWMYSQILPNSVLSKYPLGVLNMHGGFIPKYRGANVLQWAIINGDTEIGVTWHSMVEKVDAGPIFLETSVCIDKKMNALDVRSAQIDEGIKVFPIAWKNFLNLDFVAKIPNLGIGNVWKARVPKDGRIFSHYTKEKIFNTVRSLPYPWPPATILVDNIWVPIKKIEKFKLDNTFTFLLDDSSEIFIVLENTKK
jgi:methionyl-tRNA formyltransferase